MGSHGNRARRVYKVRPCEAWSAFGLASVAVVCIGCEFVAQSPWSEAEAEIGDAGGVDYLSVVPNTLRMAEG